MTNSQLSPNLGKSLHALGAVISRYGFYTVLVAMFVFFSLATEHFRDAGNLISLVHAMSPLVVIASGLALVVLAGQLDISVGSVAFLSSSVGALLMSRLDVNPALAAMIVLGVGALLGAINAFVVVIMRVNPLIATLGTMIAFRGAALQLTSARTIDLPDAVKQVSSLWIGPIPLDVVIAVLVVAGISLLHRRTPFRQANQRDRKRHRDSPSHRSARSDALWRRTTFYRARWRAWGAS